MWNAFSSSNELHPALLQGCRGALEIVCVATSNSVEVASVVELTGVLLHD